MAGPLIMLLGAWGALIPFFGHSFGYGYTPSNTWTWTAARGWFEVLPGIGAFLGGALLTTTAHRAAAAFGGWVAGASGSWFVLGTVISPRWWNPAPIGSPVGGYSQAVWDRIGMFTGLGMVIVYLAAMSLGRISLSGARDVTQSPEQLEAIRRIEGARTIPGDRPRTVDLTAAEAGAENSSESLPR
ncbi:MAG: hypothetical protein ACTHK4_13695 [Mycobacteriales bacterium]